MQRTYSKTRIWRPGAAVLGLLGALTAIPPQAHSEPPEVAAQPSSTDTRPDAASLDMARDLIKDGQYSEAASLARSFLAPEEARSGPDSPQVADVLDVIVEAERLAGKVKDEGTRALARRAIAIREMAFGAGHPEVARSVNNLANLLVESGDYVAARPLYERVLAIQERELGPDHLLVGKTLNNFANLICDMGDYAGSRPLYERALRIKEKALGPEDPQLISTLIGLGILLRLTGEYTEARRYSERAVQIAERKLRPGHPRRGSTLGTLASISYETGDFAEAKGLLERALALQERELEPDHPDVAATLGDLANLAKEAGDFKAARSLYEKALGIQARSLEPESAYLVPILDSLGEVLLEQGDFDAARAHFERGLRILESQFGPGHPDVADSLGHLAGLLERTGELPAARALLERGLRIREDVLGPGHPLVAASLASLARVAARSGDRAAAMDLAHRAEAIGRQHLRVITRELPERQALRYAATRPAGLAIEMEVAAGAQKDPAWTRTAWDDLIRSRALVLDEMAARQRSVLAAEDSAGRNLMADLASARVKEAALLVRGLEAQEPASYRRLLDDARNEKERLEKRLAEKSVLFQRERSRRDLGLSDVVTSRPADTAIVAYALTRPQRDAPGQNPPAYLAFVLGPSGDAPSVVRLGAAGRVDDLVARWRASVAAEPSALPGVAGMDEDKTRRVGTDLRALIWDPIISGLQGAARVFIVPDGSLNLVSFAALPARARGYLVETGPLIHYLSSETDLVRDAPALDGESGLLAVGGPDFDGRPESTLLAAAKGNLRETATGPFRGSGTACKERQALRFDPLPGARREAHEVADVWIRRHPGRTDAVQTLEGVKASKQNLKRLAPKFSVVHVATHTFFLEEACLPAHLAHASENPLLLSGLAFAGANHHDQAGSAAAASDSILTAEEIASMDLSRVGWMVLSGCETGLGKIHPGEGVLGLRRALRVAGVPTLIMSLWKAKDEPTRLWMRRLYERRFSGLSTPEAVRAASLDIIAERREAGDAAHPFFWGAFVAAGDWR